MRRELDVFLTAVMFFTRIPLPGWLGYTYDPAYLQQSTRYFPVVGWIVGGVSAGVFALASQGLPVSVSVLLSMSASVVLTGAFHEDGWADVCDGFGGGWTQEQVLDIMKDSRLGTYGSVALMLVLALKACALVELHAVGGTWGVAVALLVGHSVSRWAATSIIFTHEYVRADARSKAKPVAKGLSATDFALASVLGLGPMFLVPVSLWWVLIPVVGVRQWLVRWYVRRLGGYTGDALGGAQQITEVALLISLLGALS